MGMTYRRLDSNNDYSFGRGRADFLSGVDAVGQAIVTRLKLLEGEWWEDTSDGLPLWQSILGQRTAKAAIDRIITSRILGTPNVTAISNFSSSLNTSTRAYSFQCSVTTAFGTTVIQTVPSASINNSVLFGGQQVTFGGDSVSW